MIKFMYVWRDTDLSDEKGDVYGSPIFKSTDRTVTKELVTREFQKLNVSENPKEIATIPQWRSQELFYIGEYDDKKATMKTCEPALVLRVGDILHGRESN